MIGKNRHASALSGIAYNLALKTKFTQHIQAFFPPKDKKYRCVFKGDYSSPSPSTLLAMILRTPGVTFLTRAFVSLLLPCTIIALVRLAVAIQFNVVIPVWALFATGVLSLPFIAVIRRSYTLWYHSRRASALGARLAPCVRGKWIGNLDVLISAVKKNRWSYPGKSSTSPHIHILYREVQVMGIGSGWRSSVKHSI